MNYVTGCHKQKINLPEGMFHSLIQERLFTVILKDTETIGNVFYFSWNDRFWLDRSMTKSNIYGTVRVTERRVFHTFLPLSLSSTARGGLELYHLTF